MAGFRYWLALCERYGPRTWRIALTPHCIKALVNKAPCTTWPVSFKIDAQPKFPYTPSRKNKFLSILLDHLGLTELSPFLERLANETQSSAVLGLISAEQVFVVAKHEGNRNNGVTIRFAHRFHMTAETGFSQDTGGLEPGINVVNTHFWSSSRNHQMCYPYRHVLRGLCRGVLS